MEIKELFKAITPLYRLYHRYVTQKRFIKQYFPMKEDLGSCGKNSLLEYPMFFDVPSQVYVEENVKLRTGLRIINSPQEKVVVKKYTVLSSNCLIVTNNHKSTVGIPQFLLGGSHVNDKSTDVIIEEDVWVGANVTLLAGTQLGRGCIVGAGSVVSKPVPPYALVVGAPARIIARKFDKEDIIHHEKILYPESERLSECEIDLLFDKYLSEVGTFGLNTRLSSKEREVIEIQKEIFKFIEPSHGKI